MSRSILFLDDDEDLRDLMAATIETCLDAECLPLASLADLQKRSEQALRCSVALLDLNLGSGQPSGLDAHDWLLKQRFAGAVLFLTGYGQSDPLVRSASGRGITVLEKPISLEALTAALERAMEGEGAGPEARP